MKKIRLLVTASTFPLFKKDTTPRFVLDLCKSIEATGKFDCLVLVPHSKAAAVNEVIEGIKVKRYRYMYPASLEQVSGGGIIPKIKKNKLLIFIVPFFLLSQLISTILTIRKYKPQILLVNWIVPQGLIAAIIKVFYTELKIILISHGGDVGLLSSNYVLRVIGKFILKKADKVIAVSSFVRDKVVEISKLKKSEISIISYGVDYKRFEPCNSIDTQKTAPLILFIGRLEKKKGVDYLLKAIPTVAIKYPDITLKIVGNGTLKDELISLSKELNIEKNVIFIGAIEHSLIPNFFKEAILLVAPSINSEDDTEGLPNVILEAIASGTPIVTTDAGGITDIIKDKITGILVEQKNSPQLSEKIIELLEKDKLRNRLSKEAKKQLLNSFTYHTIGKKYQEIILSLHNQYL